MRITVIFSLLYHHYTGPDDWLSWFWQTTSVDILLGTTRNNIRRVQGFSRMPNTKDGCARPPISTRMGEYKPKLWKTPTASRLWLCMGLFNSHAGNGMMEMLDGFSKLIILQHILLTTIICDHLIWYMYQERLTLSTRKTLSVTNILDI